MLLNFVIEIDNNSTVQDVQDVLHYYYCCRTIIHIRVMYHQLSYDNVVHISRITFLIAGDPATCEEHGSRASSDSERAILERGLCAFPTEIPSYLLYSCRNYYVLGYSGFYVLVRNKHQKRYMYNIDAYE